MGTDKQPAKIAWFPEEGVIRLIGHHCFAKLNREGHKEALADLKKRKERRKNIMFVLSNLHILDQALAAIDHNSEVSAILDGFRSQLTLKLRAFSHFRLGDALREGKLLAREVTEKIVVGKDRKEITKLVHTDRVYAIIRGYEILQPTRTPITEKLKAARIKLAGINPHAKMEFLDDPHLRKIAKDFSRGLIEARDATEEIEILRRFVAPETISTLRNWGMYPGGILSLHVERQEESFYIGPTKQQQIRLHLPFEIDTPLLAVPIPGTGKSVEAVDREVA
jgi:hypothetical protein